MQRQSVTSSNIASIGYDESAQTLEIEFRDGGIYQYYDVPKEVYEEFINAGSHGKYFHAHIRDEYPHSKIS